MAKAKKSAGAKVRGKTKGKVSRAAVKTPVKASARKGAGRAAAKTAGVSTKSSVNPAEAGIVVEYKLFVEDSVRNLEDQVNYYIKKGWSPVGGVVLQGPNHFLQSMVLRQS